MDMGTRAINPEVSQSFTLRRTEATNTKQSSLIRKICIVVALTLVLGAASYATALYLGVNLPPLATIITGTAGALSALFAAIFCGGSKKEVNRNKLEELSFERDAKEKFVNANQNKINEVATLLEEYKPKKGKLVEIKDEDLDKMLLLVDKARTAVYQQEQFNKLIRKLESQIGEARSKEIFTIPNVFPESINDPSKVLPNKLIDLLVIKATNYFYNKDVLTQIQAKIETETGNKTIFHEILGKLNLKDYLNGGKQLSAELEESILNCIRLAATRGKFDHLLKEVQEAAKRDLIFDDQSIETKFGVGEVIKDLSPQEQKFRREALQKVINQAYIHQELRNKGKLVSGTTDEIELLGHLGYQITDKSDYHNKEFVFEILNQTIQKQLNSEECTASLTIVRKSLQECAHKARLNTVNITNPFQIQKFQISLEEHTKLKTKIDDIQKEVKLLYPEDFPLKESSPGREQIEMLYVLLKKELVVKGMLNKFWKSEVLNEQFKNIFITPELYEESVAERSSKLKKDSVVLKCEELNLDELLLAEFDFYSKWGPFIKMEMIQGSKDKNEILGEGICWAVSSKVQMMAQRNPTWTADEIAAQIKISSVDRFRQGVVSMQFKLEGYQDFERKNAMPSQMLEKEGFAKDVEITDIPYDTNTPADLESLMKSKEIDLTKSNGVLRVHLNLEESAHSIMMRLDKDLNKVWIFDPNVGLLSFENDKTDFETARKNCLVFFNALMSHKYPTINGVILNQLE
ncbi:MAG: hypothetical protein H0W88_12125 [Parachlamydiaceae bacterium]|nr:hypothetical protein [Parachlamydiaceae bacterium]